MLNKLSNKILSLGLVSVLLVSSVACNQQTALNDVQKFAPVVTSVLTAACAFTTNPLCLSSAAKIKADEESVFTVWQDYINAVAAGTATSAAWNNLNAVLTTLINDSTDIFTFASSLGGVVSPVQQAEVIALVTAAQGLLAVIEALLPAPPAGVSIERRALLNDKLPSPNAKTGKYDADWFKSWQKNWNNLPLVKERGLQIHSHNKFVRVITLEHLQ